MKIKVEVSQLNIGMGERGVSNRCPIAFAIAMKLEEYVEVYGPFGSIDEKIVEFPRSVERFVKRFDKGKTVKPFNFWLTLPT